MKKKILFISDDIRGSSGVSHISKNIITRTSDVFDWVQVAAMKNHPDQHSVIDVSKSVETITGFTNCYVRLYPYNGYGNELIIKDIIAHEKPDALLHMSDPRYFTWLYQMDIGIRRDIPMCYYHVWDNDPTPTYNKSIYESCDWIGCISKKTYDFVKTITPNIKSSYIPHGVSSSDFYKIQDTTEIDYARKTILGDRVYDFVVFSNNVNIPRKQLPNLLLSFEEFSKRNHKKMCLVCHCNPSSQADINLRSIAGEFCKTSDIIFTESQLSTNDLNKLYNISDVTINISSNEGFGLSTLESLMTETPIIATDTGGLIDQMYENQSPGEWAYPIKPTTRRLNSGGDVIYIYEDICNINSVVDALQHWYDKTKEERCSCGKVGKEFAVNNMSLDKMVNSIKQGLQDTINNHVKSNGVKIVKL